MSERSRQFKSSTWALAAAACLLLGGRASAVIQFDEAGRTFTPPPAGALLDAWNLQGDLGGAFLGTPIAPNLFVAARHFDNPTLDHLSGRSITFDGTTYTTVDSYNIPNTDLRIHRIATNSFARYATLYDAAANGTEAGQPMVVFGRGGPRGTPFYAGAGGTDPRGWLWTSSDHAPNYGTTQIDSISNFDAQSTTDTDYGDLVTFDFAGAGDLALTEGDSSGGLFVFVNGHPQLAGINLGADGFFATAAAGPYQGAAIYDARGLYVGDATTHELVADGPNAIAASSYSSRISSNRQAINAYFLATGNASLVPEPTTLATLVAAVLWAVRRRRAVN